MGIKLFKYDEEKHLGTYDGKLIPSATQLVEVMFPLDKNIPEARLEEAAKRGTLIHEHIEVYNNFLKFDDDFPSFKFARDSHFQEVKDYRRLINVYNLKPLKGEELVFVLDENQEPICYGHYDLIVEAKEHSLAFNKGERYLIDIKTVADFDRPKTALQTNLYRLALIQQGIKLNKKTYGLHLRTNDKENKKNFIPLNSYDDKELLELAKTLRGKWDGK